MKRLAAGSCLVLLFAAAAVPLAAQRFPFQVFNVEQGLPQSQAVTLAEDRDGFIWVGTQAGVARYNGDTFTTYTRREGLPSDRVRHLLVDSTGVLWIATAGGLAVWRDRKLETVESELLRGVPLRALAEDAAGNIWIGGDARLLRYREGRIEQIPFDGPAPDWIYQLIPEPDGMLTVTSHGLFLAAPDGSITALEGPHTPAVGLRTALRIGGELWVGTAGDGLFVQKDNEWKSVEDIAGRNIYRLSMGISGTFYVTTQDAGLYRRPRGHGEFRQVSTEQGLPSVVANDILEDREGNLWVGTDVGGLALLRSHAVTHHGVKDFPDPCVFGIATGSTPDSLWVATLGGAVHYRVRPDFRVLETVTARDGLLDEHVWKAVATPEGEVWLQTETVNFRRRPGERRFSPVNPPVPVPRETQDIVLDDDNRLWFTGLDSERPVAMKDSRGGWHSWNRDSEGRPISQCRSLAKRRRGGVWLSSEGDILEYDGKSLRRLSDIPELGGYVSGLFEDSRGRLWVGGDTGLFMRDTSGVWRKWGPETGIVSLRVFFLGEDGNGTIWLGTERGAFRIFPSGQIAPFTHEDGLAGLETNQFGFMAESSGAVWLGTIAGLTRYDPGAEIRSDAAPRLVIEEASLAGRTELFPEALDLTWKERTVVFQVAVLNYRNHSRAGYRVRFEGLEDEWLPIRRAGELRYTNLPPGRHRLLLQARNDLGIWSDEKALPVTVHPPFWLTNTFRISILILIAAGVAAVFQTRTRLLRKRARELEQTVSARTKELQAANSELEHLATFDPLTGLLNRRAVLARLKEALGPAEGPVRRFGCLIADLDRFKAVNDLFGHVEGDRVLRVLAGRLKETLRDIDGAGRYGGDEFLVILPGADRDGVEAAARRIAALSEAVTREGDTVEVKVSCGGIAVSGGLARPGPEAVLAAADALLYSVKRQGGGHFKVDTL